MNANEHRPDCKRCGKPLAKYRWRDFVSLNPHGTRQWGYRGDNLFCSQRCGYQYALSLLKTKAEV